MRQDEHGQQGHAEEQQHRLDNLHPRGRDHAAEEDVGEHHEPDAGDGPLVRDAKDRRMRFPAPTICAMV